MYKRQDSKPYRAACIVASTSALNSGEFVNLLDILAVIASRWINPYYFFQIPEKEHQPQQQNKFPYELNNIRVSEVMFEIFLNDALYK